jgi:L-asparaginase
VTRTPRVALLLVGGTLLSLGRDRLDLAWYIEADRRLEPDELVARVPELAEIADVEVVPTGRLQSHAMRFGQLLDVLRRVHAALDDGFDGIVVGHGTDTLEETAYFLNLTVKRAAPVVLVGSMRPASGLGFEGELNLVAAVRAAADPAAGGRGVLVVLNDTIHAARDVAKAATFRVDAFRSADAGPLGAVDPDGRVVWYHRAERAHTTETEFDTDALDDLPRVDIVLSYLGADGALVDAAVAAGARGIVAAGSGAGFTTWAQAEALDRAASAGVVVCQASRVGSGRVVRSPGLAGRGLVAAGNLTPWKARILLALALTRTDDAGRIQQMFDRY